jgi:hypothetical protein
MGWKFVQLTDAELATGKLIKLQKEFFELCLLHDMPPNVAMYGGQGSRNRGKYYFTPDATEIAAVLLASYGATDCEEPQVETLSSLVNSSRRQDKNYK